jgi:hypothetical protein
MAGTRRSYAPRRRPRRGRRRGPSARRARGSRRASTTNRPPSRLDDGQASCRHPAVGDQALDPTLVHGGPSAAQLPRAHPDPVGLVVDRIRRAVDPPEAQRLLDGLLVREGGSWWRPSWRVRARPAVRCRRSDTNHKHTDPRARRAHSRSVSSGSGVLRAPCCPVRLMPLVLSHPGQEALPGGRACRPVLPCAFPFDGTASLAQC